MSRVVQPSVNETAFSCPHCAAFTSQFWYDLYAVDIKSENPLPIVASQNLRAKAVNIQNSDQRADFLKLLDKIETGLVVVSEENRSSGSRTFNLHLSKCYNCKKIAVWVHDKLLFPTIKAGGQPNFDLPEDIIRDFEEAREIVSSSPRGAAALLRLCIQKLCKHLGEKGKNIDDDIASLVSKGLNPLVQQSLDIVRVIGNEAVHPGVIDLKDDSEIALRLFDLVNAIADQMISHPKTVSGLYAKLPEAKRKAIETRDKK